MTSWEGILELNSAEDKATMNKGRGATSVILSLTGRRTVEPCSQLENATSAGRPGIFQGIATRMTGEGEGRF
jgi:hypothetical protein